MLGILLVLSRDAGKTFTVPIRAYLEALGYVEGRNIRLDFRFADGRVERLPTLAAELVAQRPAVIATFGDAAGHAAQEATTDIPIVAMSEDLVRARLVTSMRRPERNTTGLSIMGTELDAKRLEILAEMLPKRSTVLLLADPTTHRESRPALNTTAQARGAHPARGHCEHTVKRSNARFVARSKEASPESTCFRRHYSLHCAGASSVSPQGSVYVPYINGLRRRKRAV